MLSTGENVLGASTNRLWPYSGSTLPTEAATNNWNSPGVSSCAPGNGDFAVPVGFARSAPSSVFAGGCTPAAFL